MKLPWQEMANIVMYLRLKKVIKEPRAEADQKMVLFRNPVQCAHHPFIINFCRIRFRTVLVQVPISRILFLKWLADVFSVITRTLSLGGWGSFLSPWGWSCSEWSTRPWRAPTRVSWAKKSVKPTGSGPVHLSATYGTEKLRKTIIGRKLHQNIEEFFSWKFFSIFKI